VLNLIARSENNDRRGIAALAQLAQNIDAIAVRQPKIEQHHVKHRGLQCAGRTLTVAHPIDSETALAECCLQALRNHGVVLNEQHTHSARYGL
jgi:hypothetical protein